MTSGLEYAAQAMGVHVGLLDRDRQRESRIGYVGSVRDVTFTAAHLDEFASDLIVDASRMIEGDNSYMYRFTVACNGQTIVQGRASIFLKTAM